VPSPVEQQLLQRVAHIIRRCEHELLNQAQPPTSPSYNPDRRASASSIGSSHQATPSITHAPSIAQRQSLPIPTMSFGHGNLSEVLEDVSQPMVDFPSIVWDDQPYNSAFSLGIDWEGIFPASSDTQYTSNGDPVASFSAPMWT
jgi:hypothetical protein